MHVTDSFGCTSHANITLQFNCTQINFFFKSREMVFDQNVKVSVLSISKSFFYLPCMTHLKDKSHTLSVSCWLEFASSTKHTRKITNVSQKPTEQCCSNFAEHYQEHLSEPQVPGMDVRRHRKFWINMISSFSFIMETAHLWGDQSQSSATKII